MKEISAVMAAYPHTQAIKDGTVASDSIHLNFTEFKKISAAFDDMVEKQPWDICEMAVGTFFQALDFGKPMKLLPYVTDGMFHHGSLYYDPAQGKVTPEDLRGAKVAVRAYTQTTAMWVRGAVSEHFGIKPNEMTFITTEDPHVQEYVNPPYVLRADASVTNPLDLVLSGECKAIFAGKKQLDDRADWQHVIPDFEGYQEKWYEVHKAVPINHMICVTDKLLEEDPDAVKEFFRMCKVAYDDAKAAGFDNKAVVMGREAIWPTLEVAMDYAVEQGMISRKFTIDEVFAAGIDC